MKTSEKCSICKPNRQINPFSFREKPSPRWAFNDNHAKEIFENFYRNNYLHALRIVSYRICRTKLYLDPCAIVDDSFLAFLNYSNNNGIPDNKIAFLHSLLRLQLMSHIRYAIMKKRHAIKLEFFEDHERNDCMAEDKRTFNHEVIIDSNYIKGFFNELKFNYEPDPLFSSRIEFSSYFDGPSKYDNSSFPSSLLEFESYFQSDLECKLYLSKLKYNQLRNLSFICPKCGREDFYLYWKRLLLECKYCRYNLSLTAGTTLDKVHKLLLNFKILFILLTDEQVSINQIKRITNTRYETCFDIVKKLRLLTTNTHLNMKDRFDSILTMKKKVQEP